MNMKITRRLLLVLTVTCVVTLMLALNGSRNAQGVPRAHLLGAGTRDVIAVNGEVIITSVADAYAAPFQKHKVFMPEATVLKAKGAAAATSSL